MDVALETIPSGYDFLIFCLFLLFLFLSGVPLKVVDWIARCFGGRVKMAVPLLLLLLPPSVEESEHGGYFLISTQWASAKDSSRPYLLVPAALDSRSAERGLDGRVPVACSTAMSSWPGQLWARLTGASGQMGRTLARSLAKVLARLFIHSGWSGLKRACRQAGGEGSRGVMAVSEMVRGVGRKRWAKVSVCLTTEKYSVKDVASTCYRSTRLLSASRGFDWPAAPPPPLDSGSAATGLQALVTLADLLQRLGLEESNSGEAPLLTPPSTPPSSTHIAHLTPLELNTHAHSNLPSSSVLCEKDSKMGKTRTGTGRLRLFQQ